jgi:hypothetical protein
MTDESSVSSEESAPVFVSSSVPLPESSDKPSLPPVPEVNIPSIPVPGQGEKKETRGRKKGTKIIGGQVIGPDKIPNVSIPTDKTAESKTEKAIPETANMAKEMSTLVITILDLIKSKIDDSIPKADLSLKETCRSFWEKYFTNNPIAVSSGALVVIVSFAYVGQAFFSEAWKARKKKSGSIESSGI